MIFMYLIVKLLGCFLFFSYFLAQFFFLALKLCKGFLLLIFFFG